MHLSSHVPTLAPYLMTQKTGHAYVTHQAFPSMIYIASASVRSFCDLQVWKRASNDNFNPLHQRHISHFGWSVDIHVRGGMLISSF